MDKKITNEEAKRIEWLKVVIRNYSADIIRHQKILESKRAELAKQEKAVEDMAEEIEFHQSGVDMCQEELRELENRIANR